MNLSAREKFQTLLRDLFQFNAADLDFGIYRIMNHKRAVIERFIAEDLPNAISEELGRGALAEQTQAQEALEAARQKVMETLGEDALDSSGNLAEMYRDKPIGKEYLEAQERARGSQSSEALEADIYNHLYAFFSRYWQDGDFISKRRYSKKERYAIPYNGEEVYLYWANHDQYYVKTGEYFSDYTYQAPNGVRVHFKLQQADVEQNNIKGEKRFFLPVLDGVAWDDAARTLTIPFQFRPLTGQESITYGQKNQQDAILARALNEIPRRAKAAEARTALTSERRKTDKGETVSWLEHHLRQYTRRNTSDFFIHKDLRGFLARELDFYLKNEVLNLEELEAAGEDLAEGWFQLMRLIKRIGLRIIEFLAQIENFQKMLWEKKKFITETFYCITLGNIPADFYPEIAACEAQWEEWRVLFHIDEEQANLFAAGKGKEKTRLEYLKAHPTLALDTRRFSRDFTDRLLAAFDPSAGSGQSLDEMTDGLLVYSENWQALDLLQEKYRERVHCIYIDPPYNTGNDGFLYRDSYQHSSWIAMVYNRLEIAIAALVQDGFISTSIDEHEVDTLLRVCKTLFTYQAGVVIVQTNPKGRGQDKYLATSHDYLLAFARSAGARFRGIPKSEEQLAEYSYGEDEIGRFRLLELRNTHRQFHRGNRPNLWYPLYIDRKHGTVSVAPSERSIEVFPLWPDGFEGCWTWSRELVAKNINHLHARQIGRRWAVFRKDYAIKNGVTATFMPKTIWNDREVRTDIGQETLDDVLGVRSFDSPKPTGLISKVIQISAGDNAYVLDFFAGSGTSGHAVINLNREDGGQRKFILVEMADYFDTVLLPRIKKVVFSPEWKNGKPRRMATAEEAERSPRIIKVIRLESYEDALNNLTFDEDSGQQALQLYQDDYLLRYMLRWETRKSETLLDVEQLQSPFAYKLRIHRDGETRELAVDLPETFNYLLGLDVQTRRVLPSPGGRGAGGEGRYLVYRGFLRNGRAVAIIWRNTTGWTKEDYELDRDFVAEHNLTDGAGEIFVNGDSLIPGAKSLDPIFKERMFAGVEA